MTSPSQPFPLQEKITQLETIEEYFRRPDMNLEVAIEKHKEAILLAKEIVTYLNTVESSIETVNIEKIKN